MFLKKSGGVLHYPQASSNSPVSFLLSNLLEISPTKMRKLRAKFQSPPAPNIQMCAHTLSKGLNKTHSELGEKAVTCQPAGKHMVAAGSFQQARRVPG